MDQPVPQGGGLRAPDLPGRLRDAHPHQRPHRSGGFAGRDPAGLRVAWLDLGDGPGGRRRPPADLGRGDGRAPGLVAGRDPHRVRARRHARHLDRGGGRRNGRGAAAREHAGDRARPRLLGRRHPALFRVRFGRHHRPVGARPGERGEDPGHRGRRDRAEAAAGPRAPWCTLPRVAAAATGCWFGTSTTPGRRRGPGRARCLGAASPPWRARRSAPTGRRSR